MLLQTLCYSGAIILIQHPILRPPPCPVNLKLLPSSLLNVLLMSGSDRRVSPPVSLCRGDMLRSKQDSFFSIMSLA